MKNKSPVTLAGNLFLFIPMFFFPLTIVSWILFNITSGIAKDFFVAFTLFFAHLAGPLTLLGGLVSFILRIIALTKKQRIAWNIVCLILSLGAFIHGIAMLVTMS